MIDDNFSSVEANLCQIYKPNIWILEINILVEFFAHMNVRKTIKFCFVASRIIFYPENNDYLSLQTKEQELQVL